MDIARLVLDYVKALAWPLIVLFIALAFRDQFRSLLERLTAVKGGGFEASFSEAVRAAQAVTEAAAEAAAERSASEAGPAADDETPPQDFDNVFTAIRSVVDQLPSAAVQSAWSIVERALLQAAWVILPEGTTQKSFYRGGAALIPLLAREGLDPLLVSALQDMRVLRNRAAHGSPDSISAASAGSYVDTAEVAVRLLYTFVEERRAATEQL